MPDIQHSLTPLRALPAFKALEAHYAQVKELTLRQLFADDATRGERFALETEGFYFDYSKNRITDETVKLLLELAEQSGLRAKIDAMFGGDKINITEGRSVLHVALRAPKGEKIVVDGVDVVPEVHKVLDAMSAFANRVRSRRVEGLYRQAHQEHRQHRYRRLRSRPGHGLRGAASLHPARPYVPLRLQCGQHGLRRGDSRPAGGRDPLHRLARRPSPRSRR